MAMRWSAHLAKWVGVALIFSTCCVEGASAQKRFALAIGNKDYVTSVGPLRNPLKDIDLVTSALTQIGFQVVSIQNAKRVDINREVSRFAAKLGDAGENAIGFLYYSGHGAARARDRVNYLIPVDVKDMSNDDFWFDAVSLDGIVKELVNSAPNASLFVVFDACRSELRLPNKSTSKGFESMRETNGVFIAFSTSPNEIASDIGDAGGPYARALASELVRSGQDQLQLFQNVKENVFGNTGNRQRPWESNGFVQRIYLAGKPNDAFRPTNPVGPQGPTKDFAAIPPPSSSVPSSSPVPGKPDATLLGQFGDWGAYIAWPGGKKRCFALARPSSSKTMPANRPRDPAYFFISWRPDDRVRDEVSVIFGYGVKPNVVASIEISGAAYAMYTQDDGAWVKSAADETRLVDAMRKGTDVTVKGTSAKGTASTDVYSLRGLPQALNRVGQECK
jgi:hypothetical protein